MSELVATQATCENVWNNQVRGQLGVGATIRGLQVRRPYELRSVISGTHQVEKTNGFKWMNEPSSVNLQQALRHLDGAYQRFFTKKGGYPRFKKKGEQQSATYTSNAFALHGGKLILAKMNSPLKIRWSRPLPEGATVTSVTVTLDAAGRYHASFCFETTVRPLALLETAVGVDVGLATLVTLSTGEKIPNPQFANQCADRLASAQRKLSKCTKGSKRYARQRQRVARLHACVKDSRIDHLHKLSSRLIRENQTISVETLAVKNMIRNKNLAKSISDAAWGELVS